MKNQIKEYINLSIDMKKKLLEDAEIISNIEELAVKWYEMSILGLPSASLSSFFGPLILVKNRI